MFEKDKRYTIVYIGDMLAFTSRRNVTCIESGGINDAVLRQQRKRKKFRLRIKPEDMMVFEGWDACRLDSDTHKFSGNACFNFLGSKEEIKELIDTKNLNPAAELGKVIAVEQRRKDSEDETYSFSQNKEVLVYPEIEISHAVINRIKTNGSEWV